MPARFRSKRTFRIGDGDEWLVSADGDGELLKTGVDWQLVMEQVVGVGDVRTAVDGEQVHLSRVHSHSHEVQDLTRSVCGSFHLISLKP